MSDARISADLAALGRADHAGVPSLADVLCVLPGEQPPLSIDEQLKRLPSMMLYARQLARGAWGATVLAMFTAWVALWASPIGTWLDKPLEYPLRWTAWFKVRLTLEQALNDVTPACIVVAGCLAAALARRRARRRFAAEPSHRLVERTRVWTFALELAGATSLGSYLAVMFAIEPRPSMWDVVLGMPPAMPVVAAVVPAMLVLTACVVVPHRFHARAVAVVRHRITWLVALGLVYVTVDPRLLDIVGLPPLRNAVVMAAVAFILIAAPALRARTVLS